MIGAVSLPDLDAALPHAGSMGSRTTLRQVRFFGWLHGEPAHYLDPRVVASPDGRDVTRVLSGGYVKVPTGSGTNRKRNEIALVKCWSSSRKADSRLC